MKLTKFLPYLLSIIIPLALFVINRSEPFIPFPFDIILYLLTFLGVIGVVNIAFLYKLERSMNFSLTLFKAVVDSWMEMRKKILLLPKDKKITAKDLISTLVEPGKVMNGSLTDVVFEMLKGSPPSYHRIKELMKKAEKNVITQDEAQELKTLLEQEKRDREAIGDIAGAILFGLLIIFVLGVLAALLSGGED